MPIRQFPAAFRTRIRVAYAVAWEALINTHTEQARLFIGEFASRVAPLDGLELYLSVVQVPAPMQEAVRTRTLTALDLDCLPPQTPMPLLRGWRLLRLDLMLKLIRYRRQYAEKTLELAQMVGARAEEAVTATHVYNAQDLAQLLDGQLSVERSVGEYLRAFYLPLATAQAVMQRIKAEVAGSHLAAQYASAVEPDPDLIDLQEPVEEDPHPIDDSYGTSPSSTLLG
ncbi:MAG: hypothetical protein ABI587_16845 [Gemmatimonadales bacterium]